MPRVTLKMITDLVDGLNDYSRGMSMSLDLAIEPTQSQPSRYRLAHRYGTEIVTEDWIIAVGSGQVDPVPVLRQWWAKGEEQRRLDANRGLIRIDHNTPVDQVVMMTPSQERAYRAVINANYYGQSDTVYSGGDPNRILGWEADRDRALARERERMEEERYRAARHEALARARRTEQMVRDEEALKQKILDAQEREIPDIVPRKRRVTAA